MEKKRTHELNILFAETEEVFKKKTELLLFDRSLPFATPHCDFETALMKYVSILNPSCHSAPPTPNSSLKPLVC